MLQLPTSFIFGIAESDLQTAGSLLPQKHENAQKTMWEVFAKKRGIDAPLYGSHKYTQYKNDIKLLSDLHIKGYRTAISMSRTIGKDGKPNKKAITWYRNYLSGLKAKGLSIHLCLYHWEAPEQFLKQGILDKNFEEYFLKHIEIAVKEFSDLVDYFIPINELWCTCFLSYLIGIHAPGYKSISLFFKSYFAAINLQTKAIKKIKELSPKAKIGIVNIQFPTYIQPDEVTKAGYTQARDMADNLTNFIYSDPFYFGTIDESVIRKFKHLFPKNYHAILQNAKLSDQIDYYGVNYYNSQYVKPAKNDFGYEQVIPDEAMKNTLGWPVALPPHYPSGLTDILLTYSQRYRGFGLKKLVVSENGTPLLTDSTREKVPSDDFRIFFVQEHLKQIQQAIAKGAQVDGYFLWTLLDNYEWQEGYKPEGAFGIIAVDKKTGKRIPKKSYYWYKDFLKRFYK